MAAATITAAQLEALDACPPQLEMFRATFGERLAFRSEAACVRCAAKHAQTFDWDWAARNLLRAPAQKAYEEARATAFARVWFRQETTT